MRWLNYHHLYYFLTVAEQGSVTLAARKLRLAQPTISAQVKSLEDSLGQKLFEKRGRMLALTETGRLVKGYAEQIFYLGNEMFQVVEGTGQNTAQVLRVGVVDALPKHIAYRIVDPVFGMKPQPRVLFIEDTPERLVGMLATQEIDLVISDMVIPPHIKVKAYNHHLGDSPISFLAHPRLAKRYKRNFPRSLTQAPVFLPTPVAVMRRELDAWFQKIDVQPWILGEFQDSALMKIFAKSGRGMIPVPRIVESEVCKEYGLVVVGRAQGVSERFYLISPERRLKHPAVTYINAAAQLIFQN